jgi:hypothetical protein
MMQIEAILKVAEALEKIAKEINGLTNAVIKLDERIEDTDKRSNKCMNKEKEV